MGDCCNCMGYHEQDLTWLMEEMRKVINEWAEVKKENEDFTKDIDGKIVILEKDFVDLKTYVDNYFANLDVQDEVDKKLDEMYQDGTLEKIVEDFFVYINGSLTESLLGSFLIDSNYLPSSALKIEDTVLIFSCLTNEQAERQKSNKGIVRYFDLKTNTEITESKKEIEMGHANSVVSDGTYIYIVPVWDFTNGTATTANYIYKYNQTLTNFEKIDTPQNMMGISIDNNTVYLYGYDNVIYTLSDNNLSKYADVSLPDLGYFGDYNQDFGMRHDICYLSTPQGILSYFKKDDTGIYQCKRTMLLDYTDIERNRYLGESEGITFTDDLHLLHIRYTNVSNATVGYLCEIPDSAPMYNIIRPSYSSVNHTYTISNANIAKFKNAPYELKSLGELASYLRKPNRIYIADDYEENGAILVDSVIINTGGTFTLDALRVYGCLVTLGNGTFTFTTDRMFYVWRSGMLSIAYGTTINNTTESDTITVFDISDNNSLINMSNELKNIKNKNLKIGSAKLVAVGIYKGSAYQGTLIEKKNVSLGSALAANSYIKNHVTFDHEFPLVPAISCNVLTESVNSKMGGVIVAISNITTTGFDYTIYNNTDSSFQPQIYYSATYTSNYFI